MRKISIPTTDQIRPILEDYFFGCAPEVHARCAQRIFDLCVVTSGLPIIPSDNRVAKHNLGFEPKEQGE